MTFDPNNGIMVAGFKMQLDSSGAQVTTDNSPAANYADTAAIQGIASTTRTDGMVVRKLDDSSLWVFDAEGAAVAATWCIVPTSGTGRWYRVDQGTRTTATLATLRAIPLLARVDGGLWLVVADGSMWRYAATSVLAEDGLLVVAPTVVGGAYLRADRDVDLALAITKDTADAAVLYTVPAGFRLALAIPFWEVTTSWTGGSSSAIGLSSGNAGLTTKGDVLGGATGDVAATLVSTGAFAKGTVGAKMGKPGAVIVGGETILFDRITSAFTAGVGVAHVPVRVLVAPAA